MKGTGMKEAPNGNLERLTGDILDSYDSDDRTRRIGENFFPSRGRIVQILEEIKSLLFPGYFGQKRLTRENVKYHVGSLLVRLRSDLAEQITHCLRADRICDEYPDPDKRREEAETIAREFLARIPKIRRMLSLDAQAAYDGDPAAKGVNEVIYSYPGFYAVSVYRVAHELLDLGVPLVPRIMTEYAHSITGTDIHPGAEIGKSFFIDHATGVVIGETTVIGDNVKIYQGVTLGAMSFPKDERGRVIKGLKRHPTIEDNVTIYANATILGGDTVIGKGATVNGNTFVTTSISAGSTVTGEKHGVRVRGRGRGR